MIRKSISTHGAWAVDASPAWDFRLDVPPVAMHAAPDDSFLLAADVFGNVHCLDTGSGESRWSRSFGMHNVHGVRATLTDGQSLVLLEDGRLVRLDKAGDIVWEQEVGALRSGFDATADGSLVALCAPVHSISGADVQVGAEITIHGEKGEKKHSIPLDHVVNRLRFTSEGGDLVCSSPDGEVSFLRDYELAGSARLGSPVDDLVTCLDGSLILMPAGRDGIHVLSASMESLGVYPVRGTVEDVDVSEDGSTILVKERDGLIYLLNGQFEIRWSGRMDRPVLRVDLAGDGNYAYLAESSGQIVRVNFAIGEKKSVAAADDGGAEIATKKEYDLSDFEIRQGLARLAFVGRSGLLAVLPRPGNLLVYGDDDKPIVSKQLAWSAAHLTPDPYGDRLALWSHSQLEVIRPGKATTELMGDAVAAVEFLDGGDIAVGTSGGLLRRFADDGTERWSVRVGAGVLSLCEDVKNHTLVAVCADGSVALVDGSGKQQTALDLSASMIADPDVAAEAKAQEGDEGAGEDDVLVDFWSHFGREFRVVMTGSGPVLFHGGGRVVRLSADGKVARERNLGTEVHALLSLGDSLATVGSSGRLDVLSDDLKVDHSVELASREAVAVGAGKRAPAVLDAVADAAILRDLAGQSLGRLATSGPPLALAVSPDGAQGAVLTGQRLLRFDLP